MAFLNAVATQFYARARVKLDLKRLYRAGGSAAKELLRLAAHVQGLGEVGAGAAGAAAAAATGAGSPGARPVQQQQLQQHQQADSGSTQNRKPTASSAAQERSQRQPHARRHDQKPAAAALTAEQQAAAQRSAEVASLERQLATAVEGTRQRLAALRKAAAELEEEQRVLEGGCGGAASWVYAEVEGEPADAGKWLQGSDSHGCAVVAACRAVQGTADPGR